MTSTSAPAFSARMIASSSALNSSVAMPRSSISPPACSTMPAMAKVLDATIWSGRMACPGLTSSSPVASTATQRLAPDIHLRVSHCRCQRNRTRVQALTGCEQLLARCEIQSSRSDMAALPLAVEHGDVSASRFRILLNDDVIAPRGSGAPVKMRTASPAPTSPVKVWPGRSRADHLKHRARVLDVSRANGVAIHGRGIEGRLCPQC